MGHSSSLLNVSGDRVHETHALQDKHEAEEEEEEVASLKRKLQWFTENRALLDRDTGRLKAATAEVQQLKEQVGVCSYTQNVNYYFNVMFKNIYICVCVCILWHDVQEINI